jgi:hypothetical protein
VPHGYFSSTIYRCAKPLGCRPSKAPSNAIFLARAHTIRNRLLRIILIGPAASLHGSALWSASADHMKIAMTSLVTVTTPPNERWILH